MAVQIQLHRGTAAEATAADETLAEGEIGYELDTGLFKVGDGTTPWASLPYYGNGGQRTLKAIGDVGSHTGDTTRTSVHAFTIPGGTLGANGALEAWVGARIDSAPTGTWRVEVELDGQIVAQWQSAGRSLFRGRFIQNQNDDAIQVCAPISAGVDEASDLDAADFTIDTSADADLEVFVQLNDAGDTGKTITVYSLLVRALRNP